MHATPEMSFRRPTSFCTSSCSLLGLGGDPELYSVVPSLLELPQPASRAKPIKAVMNTPRIFDTLPEPLLSHLPR